MADVLHEAGYRGLRAKGLRGKHVEALVRHWRAARVSDATVMNRMAHLRWWAERVGKANLLKSNAEYGIRPRSHVSDGTKRRDLDSAKLARVADPHVRMALRLQAAFGLRREEAVKFTPARDDRGDRIRLKGATTKGGRPREVPVLTDGQRKLLDEARKLAGGGALIPPGRNYAEQKKAYEDDTRQAGLHRNHGLRHAYALDRYESLTGWKAPAAGGPASSGLTGARRRIDRAARLTVAAELGHSRREISRTYLGA
ncbi:MAG: integrase domain-containing protein [Gammaproteobacteria bacterium]|nr:integrase domain-containing protein [Gammaproteobacteria bacterium]